ncbi:MAG TPA: hypothetical protein VH796_16580 [Nitrososphaeraceae archaeon]|jgi:uncharacterized protein (DUF2461 family)
MNTLIMVRPTRIDKGNIATTTIRIQPSVLRLLNQLKQKHGFKDYNSTIKYYLPQDVTQDKPVFLTAKQEYDLTHRQPINRLIKETSAGIIKQTNNHRVKEYSESPKYSRQNRKYQRWQVTNISL